MERPPRRRDEKLLSLKFILRCYFVQGSLLAFSCFATYYYMGWTLGVWRPGDSLTAMPPTPEGLKFENASIAYLQTLTAYFFPTVTVQIANVLCKRSWKTSLFSQSFLDPVRRRESLHALANWHLGYRRSSPSADLSRAAAIASSVIVSSTTWLARFFARHSILYNFVSNLLIDIGIVFELLLCYLFFYTPLARVYYFAPLPWHVYLFACHGTFILFAFEETKKYFRRKGHPLEFFG